MRRFFTIAASAAVAATTVLATGGLHFAGAAPASSASGSNSSTTGDSAGPGQCRKGGLLGRVVHGDLIVGGEQRGYQPVVLDRGTVSAIDSSSITLHRPDGVSVTATLTDATRFRGKTRDELAAGDQVMVLQANGSARAVVSPKNTGNGAACAGQGGAGRRGARQRNRSGGGPTGSDGAL